MARRTARRQSRRPVLTVAVAALALLLAADPAPAHRKGKAEPKIAGGITDRPGLEQTVTVRLTDADSEKPIGKARVVAVAEMTEPHEMTLPPVSLAEGPPATYRGAIGFAMAGNWTVVVRVSGAKVIRASARLANVQIAAAEEQTEAPPAEEEAAGQGGHGRGDEHVVPLGTTIEGDDLAGSDYASMAVLWIHGLAALGWIIGVLAMVIALSAHIGLTAERARAAIGEAYRRWGAFVHWGLVPVIVATGIYNMLYVTPFPLAYTPADLDQLREIPYGPLYEAILIGKLTLFAALLVTGTVVLFRVIRTPVPALVPSNPHPPGVVKTLVHALGPAGLTYLAVVPLIVGAAMALRYVHILSHVAEVLRAG